MKFTAEIVEIKAKKLASGDRSFRIIFETDQNITELQRYIAEEVVTVEILQKE